MESVPILMSLVNGDGSGGRVGHGGPSDRGGHQEKGHFKRDCPQAEASLAGGNGSCFNSNKLTKMESAPILMNLVNGGHGGLSDRGGHEGTPRGGRMSIFWAATSKYLESPQ